MKIGLKILDLYLFRNALTATLFVAVILALIMFLTQALKFLEIVLNAGSSSGSIWLLTLLALPRFFEIILPLSVMAATLFIYNKMMMDSELVAMRAAGRSSLALARPAILLGLCATAVLWIVTMWIAPASMARVQKMRLQLTSELSSVLFKEGVFNPVGKGLTVYIRKRTETGELLGLMIHDTSKPGKPPTTILAKRGVFLTDGDLQQVVVYDGTQQVFNSETGVLQRLNFERYTIDLPKTGTVRERWAEPDERTIVQLLHPDMSLERDRENLRSFLIEIHRRIAAPLLALAYPLIALCALLLGPLDRRGNMGKIVLTVVLVMVLQGLFLASYNLSRGSNTGLALMYVLALAPIGACLALLSPLSETVRRRLLFAAGEDAAA